MWNSWRKSRFTRPPGRGAGEFAVLAVAIISFGVQRIAISVLSRDGWQAPVRGVLFVATALAVVLVALHFRRFAGAWLIAAGIVLNVIPMMAHGGLMPVAYETVRDSGEFPGITEADLGHQLPGSKDIVLWRADIRFAALSDHYAITFPGYKPNIYSPGDFVMFGGMALVLVEGALMLLGMGHPLPALVRRRQRAAVS